VQSAVRTWRIEEVKSELHRINLYAMAIGFDLGGRRVVLSNDITKFSYKLGRENSKSGHLSMCSLNWQSIHYSQ
jgi:hypothetical protein